MPNTQTQQNQPTTRAPSPPPGCVFQQPGRPNLDSCTVAADAYIACYPSITQITPRSKMIQECAGYRPEQVTCPVPRCTVLEVTCNPPNDGNDCAVCMTPQACRQSYDDNRPKPVEPEQPMPTRERIPKLQPITEEPRTPETVARPACGDDPAKCASYCSNGAEAAKLCGVYCGLPANQAECRSWGESYSKLRGGRSNEEQRRGEEPAREENDETRLARMKASFRQWLAQFKNIEGRVARIAARKITIPDEVAAAVASVKGMGANIEAAKSVDELEELGQTLQNAVQTINEALPGLERLTEFSPSLRKLDSQIKQVDAQWRRLSRRVVTLKLDHPVIDEIQTQLAEAHQNRDAAANAAAAGRADDAFDALQSAYTGLDDIQEKFSAVEIMINAPSQIRRARFELSRSGRDLTRLERRGADTRVARDLLTKLDLELAAMEQLAKQRPLPVDDLVAAIGDFEDLKDDFLLVFDELRGQRREILPPNPTPVPLQLPEGFQGSAAPPASIFGPAS